MPNRSARRVFDSAFARRLVIGGVALAAAAALPKSAAAQATTPKTVSNRDSAAVAAQLDSARTTLVSSLNSRNKLVMLASYADSATVTPPGAPGPLPAAEFLDHWMEQGATLSALRPTSLRIVGPSDATEVGAWATDGAGEGTYIIVWHRRADGRWLVRSLSAA